MFPVRIKYDIISISKRQKIEIESKIISLKLKEEGLSSIEKEKFFLLKSSLSKGQYQIKETKSIDFFEDSRRITFQDNKYIETSKELKLKPYRHFWENYFLKLTVSKEEYKDAEKPQNYSMKREKDRTSFIDDNISIDLTIVKNKDITTYEAEIEIINSDYFEKSYPKFLTTIDNIYKIISSGNIYDFIYNQFSVNKIKTNKIDFIYRSCLSRPRDLEINDLTYDGILKHFSVALKIEGLNRFLIIHKSGIYLFYPLRTEENSIKKISDLTEKLSSYENSIFAGEFLKSGDIYIPYDTLIIRNRNVMKEDYKTRKSYSDSLDGIEFIQEDNIKFVIKTKKIHIYRDTVASFNQACKNAFEEEKDLNVPTDGLIFTPIDSPYVTEGQKKEKNLKKKRILSNYLDVCKYKEPINLTIDFLVKEDGLYTMGEEKFIGSKKYPFTFENYRIDDYEKYLNKVVEFEPVTENSIIVYKPRGIREFKLDPNKKYVADKLWSLIHNPIDKRTLLGEGTQMMRKFNSQLKKDNIIDNIEGLVVDIGFGKGGDFMKYKSNKKIDSILAIEPNKDFIKEFDRRFPDDKSNYLKLIEAGGQDTERIIKNASDFFPLDMANQVLNICFMISLSFFWKNEDMLDHLKNTILSLEKLYSERGGKKGFNIIYFTIEGERVLDLLKSHKEIITLNTITLEKIDQYKLYVNISDGATVKNQVEYFVFLNQLWYKTGFFPSTEKNITYTTKDYILTDNEKTYNSLFVFGIANKSSKKINIPLKSIYVDEKKGVSTEKGIFALGDDKSVVLPFGQNLYRIAVLKNYGTLYHTFLKLLNYEYRLGDIYRRLELAKEISTNVKENIEDLGLYFNCNIILYDKGNNRKRFDLKKDKWILILKCQDNYYEPIVYRYKNHDNLSFNERSFLVLNY